MRIVQLANFYTPTSGGLRTCLDQIGQGYQAAGHDRILIVPGVDDADEQTPSGRRISVRSPQLPGAAGYRFLTGRRRIAEILDAAQPDVLEVSDKSNLRWLARWAARSGTPVVLFSHERIDAILRSRVPRGFPLSAAADQVNRRLSRRVARVIVASSFAAAEFDRIGAGNILRVPLGVDLDTFRPAEQPAAGSAVPRLILVSRLSREKQPELAVAAVRWLVQTGTQVDLAIVGDGPNRPMLERLAVGHRVRFVGHVASRSQIAQLLAASDIALSPSPVETFGLATLEALACGTPVVVPDAGAARELIEPGSGKVCDGTAAGIGQAVRELLAIAPDQRRAAARAAAQRYPWSITVDRLLGCYADLAGVSAVDHSTAQS